MQVVFGENIKRERARVGMTQDGLAAALKVSREYVSDIEHGKVNVSMTRIVEIAEALKTPIGRLFLDLDPAG